GETGGRGDEPAAHAADPGIGPCVSEPVDGAPDQQIVEEAEGGQTEADRDEVAQAGENGGDCQGDPTTTLPETECDRGQRNHGHVGGEEPDRDQSPLGAEADPR